MAVVSNKIIFIHVPKTAGTSIRTWLEPFSINSNWFWHIPLEHVKKSHPDIQDAFCVIRNPWDWYVSKYHWEISRREKFLAGDNSVKLPDENTEISTTMLRYYKSIGFKKFLLTMPQTSQEVYSNGCNIILKYENLHEDFKQIQNRLNCFIPLLHLNASTKRNYMEYYDSTTKDYVYKKHKQFIENNGYEFDSR